MSAENIYIDAAIKEIEKLKGDIKWLKEERDSWEAKANSLNPLIEANKKLISQVKKFIDRTKKEEDKKEEEDKKPKPKLSVLEDTRNILAEIKKEREEFAKIRDELGELRSEQLLSGSAGGQVKQEEKKEETPHDYRMRVEKEMAEGKTEFGD